MAVLCSNFQAQYSMKFIPTMLSTIVYMLFVSSHAVSISQSQSLSFGKTIVSPELASTRHKKNSIIIIVTTVSATLGVILAMYFIHRRYISDESKAKENTEKQLKDLDLPLFDLLIISTATNNFSLNNKIGQGGFGPVYKGKLVDGQEIAVKKLSSRAFGGDQIEGNTNKVEGTCGYMAPEYAVDGLFSIKSDVFSFGILLLEIICGNKNRALCHGNQTLNLVGYSVVRATISRGYANHDHSNSNVRE
ncbi:hypothetical protein VNO78_06304 [Psophocarpus tetragonolobus]|uniref:Protein kinase domain-containing protein n=1 Tax=Psophocarpus tetragonolobus TaxID=3891 RepID=A0AAN9T129_PSOTE